MNTDFLLELGCEDLPARYVMPLAEALLAGVIGGLQKRGVAHGKARLFATPRRIAVLVAGVAAEQATQSIDLSGPALSVALKDGAPTPAALGFARKCGVEFAALAQRDGKLHYAKTEPGKPTAELIPTIFEDTLKSMDELVPKRMRWGSGEETFVRPVSWIVCLLGGDVVPLHRFGLDAQHLTRGHRFHAPEAIALTTPADYEAQLKAAKVWAEVESRKIEIKRQIEAEAAKFDGHARITEDLLDEVTALVEWPVVIAGHMEQRFLELPPEVIVATVETNQRYFTVFEDAAMTRLKPVFITIANIESRDVAQIIEGNERVVRPRLSDAMFFWEQDQKQPFASYREKLKEATYQKELGTQDARVARIQTLAKSIATLIGADVGAVTAAAALCKNDLVTKMVFEFPELQGLMGAYYASMGGEPASVASAIRDHYAPAQAGAALPKTREGQVLALADKIDSLVSIYAVRLGPTSARDPFALRRAAQGVARICVEGKLKLDLEQVVKSASNNLPEAVSDLRKGEAAVNALGLILERFFSYEEQTGTSPHVILAVRSKVDELSEIADPLAYDLADIHGRLSALKMSTGTPALAALAAAHKRIRNILKQASDVGIAIDAKLFDNHAEHALFAAMNALDLKGDYTRQLTQLATLREPVDAFFAAVMVNADDAAVRSNRLALLAQLDKLCRSVADISLLPG